MANFLNIGGYVPFSDKVDETTFDTYATTRSGASNQSFRFVSSDFSDVQEVEDREEDGGATLSAWWNSAHNDVPPLADKGARDLAFGLRPGESLFLRLGVDAKGGIDALVDSISSASGLKLPRDACTILEGSLRWEANVCGCLTKRRVHRFFLVRGHHLIWWRLSKLARVPMARAASALNGYKYAGCIDLKANEVEIETIEGSNSSFKLFCMNLTWEASHFRDGVRGCMILDAAGSEHSRNEWVDALLAAGAKA